MSEVPSAGGADEVGRAGLGGAERPRDAAVQSLAQVGLGAQADPEMQAVAERVRRWLDVPVALVSLVGPDQQVFPGMAGLPEPWATSRSTPLRHSFCRHVVITDRAAGRVRRPGAPLLRDNPAVDELGVGRLRRRCR